MTYQVKKLDERRIEQLKELETELGSCIIAFDTQAPPLASVSPDQVKKLQKLEKEINAVLVAYKC